MLPPALWCCHRIDYKERRHEGKALPEYPEQVTCNEQQPRRRFCPPRTPHELMQALGLLVANPERKVPRLLSYFVLTG
ncbi:hypothetical protein AWB78_06948 [Caballeronia calidae]|uniref:Uncharacterized protein n=1 Tax=Caballeronia calidae TaxID=1777139 RepID=A0A158ECF8_9BURK|nr:hypothetical protein AWB78_06948 [Caballeronia calidae]